MTAFFEVRKRFRAARREKWTEQPSNGGGRDAKERLFVLYSTAFEEAAERGLVLAAAIHGLKDAVIDGVSGFLLPSGAAEAWIVKIAEIASRPKERHDDFIRSCHSNIKRYYSWSIVCEKTRNLYQSDVKAEA